MKSQCTIGTGRKRRAVRFLVMGLDSVKSHVPYLKLLQNTNTPLSFKKSLIKDSPAVYIESLLEIVHNIVSGNIPLSDENKSKLKKKKKTLLRILKKNEKTEQKKQFLVRKKILQELIPEILDATLPEIEKNAS